MNFEELLSRDLRLSQGTAGVYVDRLLRLWNTQMTLANAPVRRLVDLPSVEHLEEDLRKLHFWYNPTATGKRLREALTDLSPAPEPPDLAELGDLVVQVDSRRALVTPEGRIAMWAISSVSFLADSRRSDADELLWLESSIVTRSWTILAATYRRWNRQRLSDVIALLREETSTLRPSVLGLLLVLLLNRNTAPDRRLPAPDDAISSDAISVALAEPALAFVNALDPKSRADARGLGVYRGWAIGEIARRLGQGLHRDDGIWIDEQAVPFAEERLVAALVNRPVEELGGVLSALDVFLAAYERVRPKLTSLGIAFEIPSVTRRLLAKITQSVEDAMQRNHSGGVH